MMINENKRCNLREFFYLVYKLNNQLNCKQNDRN